MSTNPEIPQWFALTPRVWTTSVEPESVTCGLVAGEGERLLEHATVDEVLTALDFPSKTLSHLELCSRLWQLFQV